MLQKLVSFKLNCCLALARLDALENCGVGVTPYITEPCGSERVILTHVSVCMCLNPDLFPSSLPCLQWCGVVSSTSRAVYLS